MKSIFDELRSPEDKPLSEENIAYVVQMNSLYRAGLITNNELRIGLGGQSIGVAGDRYVPEDQRVTNYRFWCNCNIDVAGDRFD